MRCLNVHLTNLSRLRSLSLSQIRWAGKKAASKRFTDTLHLPKTTFPLTMKDGIAPKRELDLQKTCNFEKLYEWQSTQEDRNETFVLHDGPPYANGDPHVGHALNKILKDITNRYKLFRGYKLHYVPGWDCHGLPIEQRALAEMKADHTTLDPLHIRQTARKYAEKTTKKQKAAFRRWGVLADWNSCYYSFDKQYEADQLEVFFQMFDKGYVYQDYMPVYWSPSSRTALAEAELEYKDEHVSNAVYVNFPVINHRDVLRNKIGSDNADVSVVIWTTTPWTLPCNQAVCYANGIRYSLVKPSDRSLSDEKIYLICSSFVERFSQILGSQLTAVAELDGQELSGLQYTHPLSGQTLPLLPANHVTAEKGTGLVHTAPAHGQEDFQVATHHHLSVTCMVNEDGVYSEEAGPQLAGLPVLSSGSDKVLELLSDHIIHHEPFTHSYPYDWRSKQPVIIRASQQWFVNTSSIKDRALDLLQSVPISPRSSGQGMLSQLALRTYWCISRQRSWGVPIPVFYERDSGKPLLSRLKGSVLACDGWAGGLAGSISPERVDLRFQIHDDHQVAILDFLVRSISPERVDLPLSNLSGFAVGTEFVQGRDVLDIWFDSGSSWAAVLKDNGGVSDVYLEGIDQFGGWFQSSLLTSVAVQDKAPYRSLVVHGFAMDEEGKKMSKSLGNVVDPNIVINGGKDRKTEPAYGADVLRWWAARSGLDQKVYIGPSILEKCNEQLFKMRKSLRYLLGNLEDFDPTKHTIEYSKLQPQDQYLLHLLHHLAQQVTHHYDHYQFDKVLTVIEKFTNIHIAFYSNITKDRLYCSHGDSEGRRSAQTAQWLLLEAVVRFIAPVVPHLAEEICQHLPYGLSDDSIFKTSWFEPDPDWEQPDLAMTFDLVLGIRDTLNGELGQESSSKYDVVLCAESDVHHFLKVLQTEESSTDSPLVETLQCAQVSLSSDSPENLSPSTHSIDGGCVLKNIHDDEETHAYTLLIGPTEARQCERCRRYTAINESVCARCMDVLATGWDS